MFRAFADRRTRLAARFVVSAVSLWRSLNDPYRPERHYMRGPGPKWRAKHATPLEVQRVA